MNVLHEFSRFAKQYNSSNIIQNQVAQELLSKLEEGHCDTIIDVGCGSGAIYKKLLDNNIKFSNFMALDFSMEMLELHPSSPNIQKIAFNFNSIEDFNKIKREDNRLIISSSALQWSDNLDVTLKEISRLGNSFYFSFFTSNTFSTIHKIGNISSPIYSKEKILERLNLYYNFSYELKNYQLKFEDTRSMFRYIKQSGLNGKGNRLNYREIKKIMELYPYKYLEFEVLFVVGSVKTDPKDNLKISHP